MRSLSHSQIETATQQIFERLQGAPLQEVRLSPEGLSLGFWSRGLVWLGLWVQRPSPLLLAFEGKNSLPKTPAKPLLLFLRAHAVGGVLSGVNKDADERRVFIHILREGAMVELEALLVPRRGNIVVRAEGKSVALRPPKELPAPLPNQDDPPPIDPDWNIFSFSQEALAEISIARRRSGEGAQGAGPEEEKERERRIQKKQRALEKMKENLTELKSDKWATLGEKIKVSGFSNLTEEEEALLTPAQGVAWNLDFCFSKSKSLVRKLAGTEERVRLLEEELEALKQSKLPVTSPPRKGPQADVSGVMKKEGIKGRKLDLASGAQAVIGKSAKDNLALLRKARAWDLWLHLRDYPGAHVIVRRQRNQELSESEMNQVMRWLVAEHLQKKVSAGQSYDVVIAECRYVRPIKGDRLGRVNYQNESRHSISLKA